mgnify:CR=1 FL=1
MWGRRTAATSAEPLRDRSRTEWIETMLIHLEKLGKSFGEKVVLHDVTASVEREDRIGIVGQNGAGKTTLLKILTGEYQDYDGEFSVTHGVTLGYLEQNAKLDPTLDIYGEMRATFAPVLDAMAQMQVLERKMAAQPDNTDLLAQHDALQNIVDAADGYNMDVNIKKVLSGMGFAQDTWEKNIAVLSGGELTRLRLAKLLLEKPDVLILDEPTNHLDFATMEWLENYLKGYSGAVLVVSHDRYFLDNVCTKIWEVSFQTMTTYKGNFSAYLPQKEAADALRQKQHDADVALAEKLQDYVDRNLVRASTTKMAQSRRRQLEKLEITEAPKDETNQLKFRFEYDVEPWNELVMLKNLTIQIGDRTLLEPFTYTVCRGQRLIIAGPNGAGKSTLMKLLVAGLLPTGGAIRADGEPLTKCERAYKARLGYLPQDFGLFDELTVEQFLDYMGALKGLRSGRESIRAVIEAVHLEEKRRARIRTLSGGQRKRVALAAALGADLCQIYTDVDGVYTADPRTVKGARKLEEVTYNEMLELATLGAQVLHNRSVEMAKKYGVPLVVRSSLNNSEGTVVKEVVSVERMLISGVALDTDAVRIAVIGLKDSPGVAFKLFDTLAKKNINVDMILQSIGRAGTKDISFTVDKNDLDDAMDVLEANQARIAYSELHAEKNIAKLSIVGAGMMSNPGVAAKMFESLYNEGVNINMIATSEIRVTVLINEKDGVRAMNAVHDAFNLAD